MNKIINKVLPTVLATASFLTLSFSASAEAIDEGMSTIAYENTTEETGKKEYVPITLQQQYEDYLASGNTTPEDIAEYEERIKELEEIKNGTYELPPTGARAVKSLGMTFYEQENDYYCGPASVRQMYAYFKPTNTIPTQKELAAKDTGNTSNPDAKKVKTLNTDYSDDYSSSGETAHFYAFNYCRNKFTDKYAEAWRGGPYTNATQLHNLIASSIGRSRPVLGHITDTTTSNWRYSCSGHYLVFRGYTDGSTGNNIYVLDPWKKGHGISNGSYSETASRVYGVTDRIIYGWLLKDYLSFLWGF